MLLAFQVPQGNLKLLDAHPELIPWETRDRLHASPWGRSLTMVTVASRSQMRVVVWAGSLILGCRAVTRLFVTSLV